MSILEEIEFDQEPIISKLYEKNIRTGKGKDNPCFICGRYVDPSKAKSVHLSSDSGCLLPTNDEEHPHSQGFFDVGPDCAKKIPAQYLF